MKLGVGGQDDTHSKEWGLGDQHINVALGSQALHHLDTKKDSWGLLRVTSVRVTCLGLCRVQSKY